MNTHELNKKKESRLERLSNHKAYYFDNLRLIAEELEKTETGTMEHLNLMKRKEYDNGVITGLEIAQNMVRKELQ